MPVGHESCAPRAEGSRACSRRSSLVAMLALASTVGCVTSSPEPIPPLQPPSQSTAGRATAADLPPPGLNVPVSPRAPGLDAQIQWALADAARRTGLDASALQVARAERVTWADGSLGCPQPGVMYTQALVPGHRIRIVAGRQTLDYHAGLSGEPRLCPPGRSQDPVPGDSRV